MQFVKYEIHRPTSNKLYRRLNLHRSHVNCKKSQFQKTHNTHLFKIHDFSNITIKILKNKKK